MISTIITFIASVSLFITGGHLISTNLKLHHYTDNDYKEIIMLKNKTSTHKKCLRHSKDENIKKGIQNINNIARLQEITAGNLKNLVKDNLFLISGDHNEDGARVLNDYLQSLDCNKHVIVGMMANKDHENYIKCIKNISSITTVDIPNQPNAISGKKLKDKFNHLPNVKYAESVEKAIKSIKLNRGDLLIITGSLYLCSEVLNLN